MLTELLSDKPEDIKRAGELLASGKLVAIPTETVYGLAADAFNEEAVKNIYKAKGRPSDNPLIVHISDISELKMLWTEVPESALLLADAFWPGPMTLVYHAQNTVPKKTTGGLSTVAVRMPSHPLARAIIKSAKTPLAAPSANLSGKPSPTCIAHVWEDLNGKIEAVLDGGECSVGVESTVIDLTSEPPRILRPGAISEEMAAAVIGRAETDKAVTEGVKEGETARSPGMKYRHYAPSSPVRLFVGAPDDTYRKIAAEYKNGKALLFEEYAENTKIPSISFGKSYDFAEHDRRLFSALRELDGAETIYIQCPRIHGMGMACYNRLIRASAFNIEKCSPYEVIGVTGRSGSGKGFVSALLSEYCALAHFDADEVYKKMLRSDCEMSRKVKETFPDCVRDGEIDRKMLGKLVFSDKNAKLLLEKITHPFVKIEAERFIAENRGAIIDAPLLFEGKLDTLCTVTLGVFCDNEVSIERIMKRDGIDREYAEMRLNAQPPVEFYRERCEIMLKTPIEQKTVENLAKKLNK